MLCFWLKRAAPILDKAYPSLTNAPILFHITFEEMPGETRSVVARSADDLRSLIEVSTEAGSAIIRIGIGRGFADGFAQPENIAERALAEAMVSGVAAAGGEDANSGKIQDLANRICPNPEMRWIHRFEARAFRDYITDEIGGPPTLLDPLDYAAPRIGLGWKVRSRESGGEISGIADCTSFLNGVVRVLLDELCALLQNLDRHSFLSEVILNYEAAAHDRDVWSRTARANLAIHEDKEGAIRGILKHQGGLNHCFLSSRILLEAGNCECPPRADQAAGRLDLSKAMSLAALAHHLGGWSDAIYWGAIEPRVRIAPLGDVHINHEFMDNVYEPFGRAVGEVLVKHDTEAYSRLYSPVGELPSARSLLGDKFFAAWEAEFGVSFDGMRRFLDELERVDLGPVRALVEYSRSELARLLAASSGISLDNALVSLDFFTLAPRPSWRPVSPEAAARDWFPWRFRRPRSVLRRPFIQVDEKDDPAILVAPGLVRDSFYCVMRWFHSGEIPSLQARSVEMRSWMGHANNRHRKEFNSEVASKMQELGWEARPEVSVRHLLGRPLDRNYGDIDVLAWRPASGRVLVMECKDLQFNKALGEVAEQLSDFRGEVGSDGKRDHLRKHLDRLDVLTAHKAEVGRTLKVSAPINIEGHLVFKNPVPMRFAWDRIARRVRLSLFADLQEL